MDRNRNSQYSYFLYYGVALRKESVDRNMAFCMDCQKSTSLSARRAWIEIYDGLIASANFCVALRKESVDRNLDTVQIIIVVVVALRKESVDRNFLLCGRLSMVTVALRKESVDRN